MYIEALVFFLLTNKLVVGAIEVGSSDQQNGKDQKRFLRSSILEGFSSGEEDFWHDANPLASNAAGTAGYDVDQNLFFVWRCSIWVWCC